VIFGIDVSHHQGGNLNFRAFRDAGIEFAFLKATEGAGFVDPRFQTNLRRARQAGLLVAAYHYVREGVAVQAQVDNVRRVVPTDVPVVLDVEDGSGTLPRVRTFVGLLRDAGYRVPLLYLPRWYWQRAGSPDLRGLPPLWSSRYPDNVVDDLRDEFARVPPHYWTGYGGLDVAVLQFTSSARVAGLAPLDANAFRGTRGQLAALLGEVREEEVRDLVIARPSEDAPDHWVGDGIRRRRVADADELAGLTWWIRQLGGDPEVRIIADLRVLGEVDPTAVPVQLDYARFVTDVVDQVSDRVADQVIEALQTRGLDATIEQVEEVVREVFRDAGTGDDA
jgi:GH25 family lysozyme M1 (1,4-beta-N-acetylmuramidase)